MIKGCDIGPVGFIVAVCAVLTQLAAMRLIFLVTGGTVASSLAKRLVRFVALATSRRAVGTVEREIG